MLTIATVMSKYNNFLPRKWSVDQMSKGLMSIHYIKQQPSQWAPVLQPKTRKILFGTVNFSVFIKIYIYTGLEINFFHHKQNFAS